MTAVPPTMRASLSAPVAALRGEARSLLSLRVWWILVIPPVVVAVCTAAVTVPGMRSLSDMVQTGPADGVAVAALVGAGVSVFVAALFAALCAATYTGTGFRYGTLTTTFAITPRRDRVLGAQFVVAVAVGIGYVLVTELVAVASLAVFGGADFVFDTTLLSVLALGVVIAAAWAAIGAGLVLATAAPVAATVGIVVWCLLGELVAGAILGSAISQFLPVGATMGALVNLASDTAADSLAPWPAATVALLVWAAIAVASGWLITRARDIT
ncbi:hypothetical protein DW322_18015 [Rhodococcus rhodnii]|uniref:ABC transporter permease n=2 Tax=Rhodococcus rhodnii TaxID=38312 RepID=R7WQ35_9NOCA|nr:hypothetical protein [Rhodococcus rhodnii]EOM77370.1 hypothetical protein Rrhod_1323 [Rhodococcus rhodnii LMG 5362]TXG91738.1 hypothetical protein DW322_18015 [Rhodococcus rhodnii]